jgi:hypothetical protein
MSTIPFDLDAHLAAADPDARKARDGWAENSLRILLSLGWTVADLAEYHSPRCAACPILRVTRRRRNEPTDPGARSTRLRFYVDAEGHNLNYSDVVTANDWPDLVVHTDGPRAQWSANRWFTHVMFGLAEIIDKVRATRESKEREDRELEAHLASLLTGTGYTKEDIAAQFSHHFELKFSTEDRQKFRLHFGCKYLRVPDQWSNEERVRKVCNLLTFLQQEGWTK